MVAFGLFHGTHLTRSHQKNVRSSGETRKSSLKSYLKIFKWCGSPFGRHTPVTESSSLQLIFLKSALNSFHISLEALQNSYTEELFIGPFPSRGTPAHFSTAQTFQQKSNCYPHMTIFAPHRRTHYPPLHSKNSSSSSDVLCCIYFYRYPQKKTNLMQKLENHKHWSERKIRTICRQQTLVQGVHQKKASLKGEFRQNIYQNLSPAVKSLSDWAIISVQLPTHVLCSHSFPLLVSQLSHVTWPARQNSKTPVVVNMMN